MTRRGLDKSSDVAAMGCRERRLEVAEVSDCAERLLDLALAQDHVRLRLDFEDLLPGGAVLQRFEEGCGSFYEDGAQPRVVSFGGAPFCHLDGCLGAAE